MGRHQPTRTDNGRRNQGRPSPLTPTDATKTLGELQVNEGKARAAQRERADADEQSEDKSED